MSAPDTNAAIAIYETNADGLALRYDAVAAPDLLAPVIDLLPPPCAMLDVGAGSGRDAAWFAAQGYQVAAAEPVAAFRAAIARKAPSARLIDARLPELAGLDGEFGLILASALWHHLDKPARDAAFARLAAILAPAGRLLISLRHGPVPADAPLHALSADDEASRAAQYGLRPLRIAPAPTNPFAHMAANVSWTWLVLEKDI